MVDFWQTQAQNDFNVVNGMQYKCQGPVFIIQFLYMHLLIIAILML